MELMVVAAIIAILSLIAIPQYRIYQAKALRVEGMNLLTGYMPAAQAARAEFGYYPGNMVETDYKIVGTVGYRFRTNDNAGRTAPIAHTDPQCIRTAHWTVEGTCNCGGLCAGWRQFEEKLPTGVIGSIIGPFTVSTVCNGIANLHVSDNSFSVRTGGIINLTAASADRLGMDERKQIVVCENGIH